LNPLELLSNKDVVNQPEFITALQKKITRLDEENKVRQKTMEELTAEVIDAKDWCTEQWLRRVD
jgi:hypothetical protein